MKKNGLTVAVPTFDRPNEILRLVKQLKVYLKKGNWNLIIYDNDSKFFPDLEISNYKNAKIVKRNFNLGPIANILRIFEECETDWLMIIGDDDELHENFFEIVMDTISFYNLKKEFVAFKFKSELNPSQEEKVINSVEEYFKYNSNPDQFSATALISTWLYRPQALKPYVRQAYLNAGLQIPHVVPVLEAIESEKAKIIYLTTKPIKWNPPESAELSWSFGRTYSLMIANFLIYPLAGKNSYIKNILKGIVGYSLKSLLGFLLKLNFSMPNENFKNILFIFSLQGYKYFFASLIFIFIRPFFNIKYIRSAIIRRVGHSNTNRM